MTRIPEESSQSLPKKDFAEESLQVAVLPSSGGLLRHAIHIYLGFIWLIKESDNEGKFGDLSVKKIKTSLLTNKIVDALANSKKTFTSEGKKMITRFFEEHFNTFDQSDLKKLSEQILENNGAEKLAGILLRDPKEIRPYLIGLLKKI